MLVSRRPLINAAAAWEGGSLPPGGSCRATPRVVRHPRNGRLGKAGRRRPLLAGAPRGGVAGEAQGQVPLRPDQIVAQGLEAAGRIVGVGGGRGPAARGAAAGGIVGEGGDRGAAVLADDCRPVEPVDIVSEVAAVGVDDPHTVAVRVVEMPHSAGGPAHVAAAGCELPEPVIGVGDAPAVARKPGRGPEAPQIAGVAHRLVGRRHVFDREPVQHVIVVADELPVPLPQRNAFAFES